MGLTELLISHFAMTKNFSLLILSLLLSGLACSSSIPNQFVGTSTTWADYPTKPDPMPAMVEWYVAPDSSYAELKVKSKSRGEIIDIPNAVPVKFFLRRGEWHSDKFKNSTFWDALVRQKDDSLW